MSTTRNPFRMLMATGLAAIGLLAPSTFAQLPAFPGAEGFGSTTPGGRGGAVLEVTHLNDSGPGSLRAALEASGPRTVVFRTGGTIELASDLRIRNPFVTVAGQTAPGGGIQVKNYGLQVETHDVVIRGLRFRLGKGSSCCRDALNIQTYSESPHDIIIDHCSLSWGTDETMATWQPVSDITIQWCIFSEALLDVTESDISHALLIGADAQNISIHHNLFANNKGRTPRYSPGSSGEFINNVVYNWRWHSSQLSGKVNVMHNRYITGPNWTGGRGITAHPEDLNGDKVYISGNIGPFRTSQAQDDWVEVMNDDAQVSRSATPVIPGSGITTQDANDIRDLVLEHAGAQPRDAVDTRSVNDVLNVTGDHIHSETEVGGWDTLAAGSPPADADSDGMPDTWETSRGLDPDDPSDRNGDENGNGYTNLEDYLNSLIVLPGGAPPAPPQNLQITS